MKRYKNLSRKGKIAVWAVAALVVIAIAGGNGGSKEQETAESKPTTTVEQTTTTEKVTTTTAAPTTTTTVAPALSQDEEFFLYLGEAFDAVGYGSLASTFDDPESRAYYKNVGVQTCELLNSGPIPANPEAFGMVLELGVTVLMGEGIPAEGASVLSSGITIASVYVYCPAHLPSLETYVGGLG